MITYNLQFYADSRNYRNRLFSFRINHEAEIFNILLKFYLNNNSFRSIFVKTTEKIGEYELISSKELYSYFNFFATYTDKTANNIEYHRNNYNLFLQS